MKPRGRLRALRTAAVLLPILFPAAFAAAPPRADARATLRVLTVNVWSGLDYQGFLAFGEYEPAVRREARFDLLAERIREAGPDVVFIQEANFAGPFARRLARALGYDQIHKVVNGGIKIGPFGPPLNFKEGMAILARPELGLARVDAWKLSGPGGLYGDVLTFHFSEAIFALAGRISVRGRPVYVVNVHLAASPPGDEASLRALLETPAGRGIGPVEFAEALAEAKARTARRDLESRRLAERLDRLPAGAPVVVAGDFNAPPGAGEIRGFVARARVLDAMAVAADQASGDAAGLPVTWDPVWNENIAYSLRPFDARGRERRGYALLEALECGIARRIDYVFLNKAFRPEDVVSCRLAVDAPRRGLHASDHYGVFAEIALDRILGARR